MRYRINKIILVLILMLLSTKGLFSQQIANEEIESILEELFALQSDNINYEELYENLLQLYLSPLNINNASKDELRQLYILSDQQINSLHSYIEIRGPLLSKYELQAIPGFNKESIQRLLPFIKINEQLTPVNKSNSKKTYRFEDSYLLLRYSRTLSSSIGYTSPELKSDSTYTSRYAGSPDNFYVRYRSRKTKDYSIGFTTEKDAGEVIEWDPKNEQFGMDFYSYHIMLENRKKIKRVIIGDYQIQFGQSVLLGSGFNIGKGSETVRTIRRNNLGIRPYTSVVEQGFLRGGALTYVIGNIEVTGFYSNVNQDLSSVTFNEGISQTTNSFTLRESGLHRTTSEQFGKNQINEQTFGLNALYNHDNFQAGVNLINTSFSEAILKRPTLSNQFDFSGNRNYGISLFSTYTKENYSFFGEIATSKSNGIGGVFGLISSLSKKIDLSILYRYYDKNFHSFYGSSFGESANVQNENGIYWGTKVQINKRLHLNSYFDYFKFPWLKQGVNRPSNGYEYMTKLVYQPTKGIHLFLQYREESKDQNINISSDPITSVRKSVKKNYIFSMSVIANEIITLKTRVQFSNLKLQSNLTSGYAVVQDINIDLGKVLISGRAALFDTDNFDNRQYVYERNVLYSFSIPAYQGVGARQYIMLQFKPMSKITLWIRYSLSSYRDRLSIGSGLDQIDSSVRRDLRAQIRYKF